jgi:hypothetical protein
MQDANGDIIKLAPQDVYSVESDSTETLGKDGGRLRDLRTQSSPW